MEDALIYDGWAGLSQVIYSIPLSEKGHSPEEIESSWDKLLSDATSGNNYVYHLLRYVGFRASLAPFSAASAREAFTSTHGFD